jgi:hypothetical protein
MEELRREGVEERREEEEEEEERRRVCCKIRDYRLFIGAFYRRFYQRIIKY